MKSIVFGGSGFVGSHIADALSEAGHEVTVFDMVPSPHLGAGQSFVAGDVADRDAVAAAVAGNAYVYHFAGMADIAECRLKPFETAVVNVLGTLNVLEAARAANAERFVYASSIYVSGDSGSFYRVSKHASELYIEEYGREFELDYTILRYGTLYGRRANERNSVHRYLHQALQERRIVAEGTGDELREYIHVEDAARLSVKILDDQFANRQVVLTGHHPLRFGELLTLIREIVGPDVEIQLEQPDGETGWTAGHYAITPYSFRPPLGRKLVSAYYVDLGQGLLDCLQEITAAEKSPA